MAEDGPIAAGQDRRHPSPLIAEVRVADGVDATVDAVQAAGGDAIANRARREAGGL
jgi:hypothetical protein